MQVVIVTLDGLQMSLCTKVEDYGTQSPILRRKFLDKGYATEVIDVAYKKYRKEYFLEDQALEKKVVRRNRLANNNQGHHRLACVTE